MSFAVLAAVSVVLPTADARGDACASSTVVYDMTGPTCPNGDEWCNFSVGFHFYQSASRASRPLLLMATGYDLNTYEVTQLTPTMQVWRPVATTVFEFARQYESLHRILLEVDVDPETGVGIAPYQDKPVRIFRVLPDHSIEELWRNADEDVGIEFTGVSFSLPGGSGPRHFVA